MPEIVKWADICNQFSDGLLLGNGASVAVYEGFHYDSLFKAAQENKHFSAELIRIFRAFDTTDFEFVLRRLCQAQLVNRALGIENGKVEEAYREVREALIATVRGSHVSYDVAMPYLSPIYRYMQHFKTVLSLNYDLVVYWAMMAANNELGPWFKDAFLRDSFREDWEELRKPYAEANGATLVFYPHGNLVLARNSDGRERKLFVGSSSDLLNEILRLWEQGDVVPIIVSEGTSTKKQRSIESASYTHRVFREVIRKIGEDLVVYGWSASEQDQHILDQIKHAGIKKVAISVHGNNQVFMARVDQLFKDIGVNEVLFFDSESPGCWIHPEGAA